MAEFMLKKTIFTNKTKGIRVTAENQTYFDVLKTDAPNTTLQMLALKLNYNLSRHIYTTS
tara:strand:+ start:1472 stop:1651 length:180 start_codon:yes stop_codon:yes gene_type:complete